MKKNFLKILLATIMCLCFTIQTQTYANAQIGFQNPSTANPSNTRDFMRKQFEQRLNLSEKQKAKAKSIHNKGRQEMRPIIMQIEVKRQEIEVIKLNRMSERAQQEQINQINEEIKELEKQAQDIRKKNTQEFEKILNKKQKAELEKMKAEGRARFERFHQARPPFQGLGSPSFLIKPLLPPPNENRLFNK